MQCYILLADNRLFLFKYAPQGEWQMLSHVLKMVLKLTLEAGTKLIRQLFANYFDEDERFQ